jgi:hypothetical protein
MPAASRKASTEETSAQTFRKIQNGMTYTNVLLIAASRRRPNDRLFKKG